MEDVFINGEVIRVPRKRNNIWWTFAEITIMLAQNNINYKDAKMIAKNLLEHFESQQEECNLSNEDIIVPCNHIGNYV